MTSILGFFLFVSSPACLSVEETSSHDHDRLGGVLGWWRICDNFSNQIPIFNSFYR